MLKLLIGKEIFMFLLLSFKILIVLLLHVFKVKLKLSSLLLLKCFWSLKIFFLLCNKSFFVSNLGLTFHLLIDFKLLIHFLEAFNVWNQLLKLRSFNKNLFWKSNQESFLISLLFWVPNFPNTEGSILRGWEQVIIVKVDTKSCNWQWMGLNFKHSFNDRFDSKNDDESRSIILFCTNNQTSSFFQRHNLWKLDIRFISCPFLSIHRLSLLLVLITCWLLSLSILLSISPWDFSKSFISSTCKNSYLGFSLSSLVGDMRNLFNTIKVDLSFLLFELVLRIVWVFEIPDVNHSIKSCRNKAEIIIKPTDWFDLSSMVFEDHVWSAFSCVKVEDHDWVCICTSKQMTSIWELNFSTRLNVNFLILLQSLLKHIHHTNSVWESNNNMKPRRMESNRMSLILVAFNNI